MRLRTACMAALLCLACLPSARAEELIELTVWGDMKNQALLYRSEGGRAAVLVHQSGATMESWRDFAKRLESRGMTALSLANSTPSDVAAAVGFLQDEGHDDIVLIGASIGGGAVLQAVKANGWPSVRRIVLLANSSGPGPQSSEIAKLFLVAKQDFYAAGTYSAYEKTAEPKRLVEFEGREHGQALLEGEHAEQALDVVLSFIDP